MQGQIVVEDYLGLQSNSQVKKLILTKGKSEEKILYTREVKKMSEGHIVPQTRVLMVTERAIYNLHHEKNGWVCKRRILIKSVGAISLAVLDNEFALHVPEEYDYRLKSSEAELIVNLIRLVFNKIMKGRVLKLFLVSLEEMKSMVVTKKKLLKMCRKDVENRTRELAKRAGCKEDDELSRSSGDDESPREKDEKVEQLIENSDKPTIESFDILRVLGRGGFGKVLQVRKKNNGKVYAMKVLKKSKIATKKALEHTKSERRVLETFQHPFLMHLQYAFQNEHKLYLVMDFMVGGELYYHLKRNKKFTEDQARFFICEILLGLGKLHSLGFCYRDLKPENVLLDDQGHVVLADFGLAKELGVGDEAESTFSFAGTPEYLAPEIIQNLGHGKAVDWWCLGILLYELVSGSTPFYASKHDEMYHSICHSKVKYPPTMSAECSDLISKLLVRKTADRLGSGISDYEEIKEHPFFANVNWDKVLSKEVDPLFKPKTASSETYVGNFAEKYLKEDAVDSIVKDEKPRNIKTPNAGDHAMFAGFTFRASDVLLSSQPVF